MASKMTCPWGRQMHRQGAKCTWRAPNAFGGPPNALGVRRMHLRGAECTRGAPNALGGRRMLVGGAEYTWGGAECTWGRQMHLGRAERTGLALDRRLSRSQG